MQLGYEKHGSGELKLTLLHGMGGIGKVWRPIVSELENEFEILTLDQRGHGKSLTEETSFHPLDYASDVKETLESLHFLPTWLIGHSMGVRTACAASHLLGTQIKGMILIDLGLNDPPGAGANEAFVEFLKKIPESFETRVEMRNFLKSNAPDDSFVAFLMATSQQCLDTKRYIFPFKKESLVQTYYDAKGVNLTAWVKEAANHKIPILLLRGQNSRVWTEESFLKDKNEFKGFSHVQFRTVKDAGHGLPFEKRKEFVSLVKEFIHAN